MIYQYIKIDIQLLKCVDLAAGISYYYFRHVDFHMPEYTDGGPGMEKQSVLSMQALKRLPGYYNYLQELQKTDVEFIAAPAIAKAMGFNEVQVRKDLASVSSCPGIPKKGFPVHELIVSIGGCLGYNNSKDAILVGAGRLGKALLSYDGLEKHGIRIVAAFDSDEALMGRAGVSKQVFPMEKLPEICRRMHIHIGIIAVPAAAAQEVCDLLTESGILAIYNFAPVHLNVPETVLLHSENFAAQLAILSRNLEERIKNN